MQKRKDNRGAQALRRQFPDRGATVKLAEMFGVKQSVASRWRSGDRTPDLTNRQAFAERLGIGLNEWDLPPLPDAEEPAPASERRGGEAPTGTHGAGE